jgi:hypothetical protein
MFTSFGLEILGQPPDESRTAFTIYYGLRHPGYLTDKGKANLLDRFSEDQRQQIIAMPKHQFFELYLLQKKWHSRNAKPVT